VLVAISGGPDSVALGLAFLTVAREPGRNWQIRLGHVNHGLRGAESEADEAFVRELARRWQVDLDVARLDTTGWAQVNRLSIETAAREQRYAALREMLQTWPGDVIATGHTLDDQAETVILHLTRGAGLDGLAGMAPWRGDIVRPFLSVPRRAVLHALEAAGQASRTDRSNADLRHRRNRVRHVLLPAMEDVHPGAAASVARASLLLSSVKDYLDAEAAAALSVLDVRERAEDGGLMVAAGAFRALHEAVQGQVLRVLVTRLGGYPLNLAEEHMRVMRSAITRARDRFVVVDELPGSIRLISSRDHFLLTSSPAERPSPLPETHLSVPGDADAQTGRFEARLGEARERTMLGRLVAVSGPYHGICDAAALGPGLTIRSRRPGDRMQPVGIPGSRKIQDLLVDRKIPPGRRDRIPIVENARHIVWVPGIALDRRAVLREDSEAVAYLRFRPFI
jgi:tRNA(Ile)-lysidine synthase